MDIAITRVDCYPTYQKASDIVFIVYCNASQDGADWPFSQQLDLGDGPFKPLTDVTQDDVIGWVNDALGKDGLAAIQSKLDGIVAAQKAPDVVSPPLPWAKPEVVDA